MVPGFSGKGDCGHGHPAQRGKKERVPGLVEAEVDEAVDGDGRHAYGQSGDEEPGVIRRGGQVLPHRSCQQDEHKGGQNGAQNAAFRKQLGIVVVRVQEPAHLEFLGLEEGERVLKAPETAAGEKKSPSHAESGDRCGKPAAAQRLHGQNAYGPDAVGDGLPSEPDDHCGDEEGHGSDEPSRIDSPRLSGHENAEDAQGGGEACDGPARERQEYGAADDDSAESQKKGLVNLLDGEPGDGFAPGTRTVRAERPAS